MPEIEFEPISLAESNQEILISPSYSGIDTNPAAAYLISLNSKRSRQTMKSFLNNSAKIAGYENLKECEWHHFRRHHIHAIMEALGDLGRAPSTINTYLAALKGVALEAWSMKLIDTDTYQRIIQVRPVRGSRLPKGRSLEKNEIQSLLLSCESDKSSRGIRDAAIFSILLGCGLRRSEVVSINMEHVTWGEQSIKILGKGNKERQAFMPDGTLSRLKTWAVEVRGEQPGPLFSRIRRHDDLTDTRMTDQAIYFILEQHRLNAGLAKFAPHDLRRTFASTMLANGEDLITVKDALGHSSLLSTQKYDKRGDERLKQASKRFIF